MNRDWLSLTGNIAIVGSLLFVGYQIQQDRELASAQLQIQTWLSISSWQTAMMGENPSRALSKALTDPESLSAEDVESARWYVASYINYINHFSRLRDLGLGPSNSAISGARAAGRELGSNPLTRTIVLDEYTSATETRPWYPAFIEAVREADAKQHKTSNERVLEKITSETHSE